MNMTKTMNLKRGVVLLSGGMDSATVLAMARARGYTCYALCVDYGQRHHAELAAAKRVAGSLGAHEFRIVNIDLTGFGGSALTDNNIAVPQQPSQGIPLTYVPARNTIMLSLSLAWAEVLDAQDIFIGVNAVDYSGYPDCRGAYIEAFERMANLATKAAVEGRPLTLHAPLLEMSKAEIVRQGVALGVDFAETVSCYQADESGRACGVCDACRLRSAGFDAAGIGDPTIYRT
jgi:7-cyano-7-deazaguanine synthase